MICEPITYTDFDGMERTENFYFNLTEAEITEWSLSVEGGLQEYIDRIVNAKSQKELVELFKTVIEKAYGEKSADGRRFMKSPEIFANFAATQAFSDFYMSLATDTEKASKFINALAPNGKFSAKPGANPAAQAVPVTLAVTSSAQG